MLMTRARGIANKSWAIQVVNVEAPHITSAAQLVLLAKHYWSQDKTNYVEYKMSRIRRRWMKEQWKNRVHSDGLVCALCGKTGLIPFNHNNNVNIMATLDHIIPIFLGGNWKDPSNFQIACYKCNITKAHLTTDRKSV